MRSDTREEISAALDAYHASLSRVLDLKCDALTTPELLACLQRLEVERRRQGRRRARLDQPTRWASLRGRARRDAAHGVGQPATHHSR
ncbi:hypothetical protein TMFG_03449 [Mycobacterium tuberculosis SUMu006]|nr:hypothetical protein TMFG_03449 [Mycobacterium tuberculosis SUMu006]